MACVTDVDGDLREQFFPLPRAKSFRPRLLVYPVDDDREQMFFDLTPAIPHDLNL